MAGAELLNWLIESPAAYRRLLEQAGCLAAAAHRLAEARCQAGSISTDVPTARELSSAAYEIARRLGLAAPPSPRTLAAECLALGLAVL